MLISLNFETIKNMDISAGVSLSLEPGNADSIPGLEPHRFYAYLSTLFDNTIIMDIGTRVGNSALSLSHNPTNQIISYDILDQVHGKINKHNIDFRLGDFMTDSSIDWNNVSIILIDVDPHDGRKEIVMMNFLRNISWSGLLLHDDISTTYWPETAQMWNNIPEEKYDVTHLAHFSGTGLVNFGNKHQIQLI